MNLKKYLKLLYPPRCPLCGNVMFPKELVCNECCGKIRYVKEPRCFKCGKHLKSEETEFCHDCMQIQHVFDSGISLYEYETIKDSLYQFKYHNRCEYAEFYAKEIAGNLGIRIMSWKPDAFVPVPLYKNKERLRGYNQAELVALELGNQLNVKVKSNWIVRTRKTAPMKELNPVARQINLKKAFHITRDDVKLRCVVIVDDIYTTGATMDEMARVLKLHGVEKVHFVTLASGDGL